MSLRLRAEHRPTAILVHAPILFSFQWVHFDGDRFQSSISFINLLIIQGFVVQRKSPPACFHGDGMLNYDVAERFKSTTNLAPFTERWKVQHPFKDLHYEIGSFCSTKIQLNVYLHHYLNVDRSKDCQAGIRTNSRSLLTCDLRLGLINLYIRKRSGGPKALIGLKGIAIHRHLWGWEP